MFQHLAIVNSSTQGGVNLNTDQILQYWTKCMIAEDLTEVTIKERIRFIRNVEKHAGNENHAGNIRFLTRMDLVNYLGSNLTWSNSTKQHYRSALHVFFTWVQDEGFRLDNPAAKLPRVKSRKRQANPLSTEEIQHLLKAGIYRKTRLMIALHYYLGLRVSEIAQLHSSDINCQSKTLTTIGKGKKKRVLPLNDVLWNLLREQWCEGYFFPNWKANHRFAAGEGHILGRSVSDLLSRAMKRAGITNHKPHDLRAATATEQSRAGVSAFVIQQNMRHQNADTTAGYIHINIQQMRDGFNKLPVMEMPTSSNRRRPAA